MGPSVDPHAGRFRWLSHMYSLAQNKKCKGNWSYGPNSSWVLLRRFILSVKDNFKNSWKLILARTIEICISGRSRTGAGECFITLSYPIISCSILNVHCHFLVLRVYKQLVATNSIGIYLSSVRGSGVISSGFKNFTY